MEAKVVEPVWECVVCRKPRKICDDEFKLVARCDACGAYQQVGALERAWLEAEGDEERAALIKQANIAAHVRRKVIGVAQLKGASRSLALDARDKARVVANVIDRFTRERGRPHPDALAFVIVKAETLLAKAREADTAAESAWRKFAEAGADYGAASEALRRSQVAWLEVAKLGDATEADEVDVAQAQLFGEDDEAPTGPLRCQAGRTKDGGDTWRRC